MCTVKRMMSYTAYTLTFKEIDQSRCHWIMRLCGELPTLVCVLFRAVTPTRVFCKDVYTFYTCLCSFYCEKYYNACASGYIGEL